MPFHPSGHKPGFTKKVSFTLKQRLPVFGLGSILIFGGVFRLMHGAVTDPLLPLPVSETPLVITWLFQPMFSGALIATGGIFALSALIPTSWIEKAANRLVSSAR